MPNLDVSKAISAYEIIDGNDKVAFAGLLSAHIDTKGYLIHEIISPGSVIFVPFLVVVSYAPRVSYQQTLMYYATAISHLECGNEGVGVTHSNATRISLLVIAVASSAKTHEIVSCICCF